MSNYHVELPKGDGTKLLPGYWIVISVGLTATAIGVAISLWLGPGEKPEIWFVVTLAAVFLTICISAFGVYRDRVQAKREDEYMKKLRAGDEKFRMDAGK